MLHFHIPRKKNYPFSLYCISYTQIPNNKKNYSTKSNLTQYIEQFSGQNELRSPANSAMFR